MDKTREQSKCMSKKSPIYNLSTGIQGMKCYLTSRGINLLDHDARPRIKETRECDPQHQWVKMNTNILEQEFNQVSWVVLIYTIQIGCNPLKRKLNNNFKRRLWNSTTISKGCDCLDHGAQQQEIHIYMKAYHGIQIFYEIHIHTKLLVQELDTWSDRWIATWFLEDKVKISQTKFKVNMNSKSI